MATPGADDDTGSALRSQRRLLNSVAIACIVYYWFDLHINCESSFISTPVKIGSTHYLPHAMWATLIWAGCRYGQRLYQVGATAKQAIMRDFASERMRLARAIVQRYLSHIAPSAAALQGSERATIVVANWAEIVRHDPNSKKYEDGKEVASVARPYGPHESDSYAVINTGVEWRHSDGTTRIDTGYPFGITRVQLIWLNCRSAIASALKLPSILDYAVPLLLLAFAVLSLTLAAWRVARPDCGAPPGIWLWPLNR